MGYLGRYRLCKFANADAGLLNLFGVEGYTASDIRAHCREYALTPGDLPIHIPMVAPPSAPTTYQVNTGRRKSLEVRLERPEKPKGLSESTKVYLLILAIAGFAYWKFK